jgi:regulator of sigma E protease
MSPLLFILILLILVVAHEYGHFIVARLFGVRVDEFGIGYPPRALSLGKWWGTEYTVNWLPFGGFVKIYGEDGEGVSSADKKVSLAYKPWWAQVLVLSAGVIANALLAWALFWFAASHGAPITVEENSTLKSHAHVVITSVLPESPADVAGVQANDRLVALSTHTDTLANVVPSQVTSFIQQHLGTLVQMQIERKNSSGTYDAQTISLTPVQGVRLDSTNPAVGISMGFMLESQAPLRETFILSGYETYRWLVNTAEGMVGLFAGVFTGTSSLKDISGPVGIAGQVGSWYTLGFGYLAYFMAIISVNLAVINLIPIPALDGGRIVFVLLEAITRRKIPTSVASTINTVGFLLLIALMLVVTWQDVWKLL